MAPPGRRGPVVPLRSIAVGSIIRRDGGGCGGGISTSHGRGMKKGTINGAVHSSTTCTTDCSFEVMANKPVDVSFSVGSTVSADSFGLPLDALSSSDEASIDLYSDINQRQPGSRRRPRQFRNFRDELEYMNFESESKISSNPETLLESTQEDEDDDCDVQRDSPMVISTPPCSPFHSVGSCLTTPAEVPSSAFLLGGIAPSYEDENDENGGEHSTKVKSSQHQRTKQERRYWKALVITRIETYGSFHMKTADGLMQLGNAQLQCREYQEALNTFKTAHRILKKVLGDTERHVAIARVLDRIGLAACKASAKSVDELHSARSSLHQSFLLRYDLLGPWHVDTVESLNNLARVQMLLNQFHEARRSYYEVLRVRRAIFGPDHPSVAVTAHSLAKACTRMNQPEEAFTYFQMAMEVYKRMDMPKENATFVCLMQDIKRLERVLQGIAHR